MAVEVTTRDRATPDEAVIRTEGLTKVYAGRGASVHAVDRLDLEVEEPAEAVRHYGAGGPGAKYHDASHQPTSALRPCTCKDSGSAEW